MAEPTQAKAGLEKIVSDLNGLIRIAKEADQDLLAYMLDMAKIEAEHGLGQMES